MPGKQLLVPWLDLRMSHCLVFSLMIDASALPCGPTFLLLSYLIVDCSGKSWHEKVKDVRGMLTKRKADAFVVTALDEVACKD